ncbi:MAG: permease [Candidatus Handelsmanbacteria bacterium]|nr:permease [Candidatus Handelsmanbacteria bacterium]
MFDALLRPLLTLLGAVQTAFQDTYTGRIAAVCWDLLAQMWYFVLIGAALSTLAWRFLPRGEVGRVLSRRGSIAAAAFLALVSPLCTFAAIPVVGSLLAVGASAAPLIAFLVASPLMNPSLLVYTAGALGWEMALARVLTAFSLGAAAGLCAQGAVRRGLLDFSGVALDLAPGARIVGAGLGAELRLLARRLGVDLAFIGKYFALGIFVAALTKTFLSADLVRQWLGPGSYWGVPLAVGMGVPLYACGGGTIPIVQMMMNMGMSPGAALAFFIAGPATKFQTLAVLGAVFGRRLLVYYLAVVLAGALFWGYVYPFGGEVMVVRSNFQYDEMSE